MRGHNPLAAVGIDFRAQCKFLPDVPLQQPSTIGEVAKSSLGDDLISGAAIAGPFSPTLLHPKRQLIPDSSSTQTLGQVSRGNFDHGINAKLRAPLGRFHKSVLASQFNVFNSVGAET